MNAPCPRAKEKPQQDDRRGEIMFRIKLHTHQRCLEVSNKTLCTPGPSDPTETEPDLCLSLLWGYGSAVACCRGRASGCSYLVTQTVLEVAINPIIESSSRGPQTAEQLCQRNSHTVKKFLGPTTDFPSWGSAKGTEKSQEI